MSEVTTSPDENQPFSWRDALKKETEAAIEKKRQYATELGMAAVLFMPRQVTKAIQKLALREASRYKNPQYNPLHIMLLMNGVFSAAEIFKGISPHIPNSTIDQDSFQARLNPRGELDVIKSLEVGGPRLYGRQVVLLSGAMQTGKTTRAIMDAFVSAPWTANNAGGGPASSVTTRTLVAAEGSLSHFDTGEAEACFLTPQFVKVAGSGNDAGGNSFRWRGGIFIPTAQPERFRSEITETLGMLGPRLVVPIEEFTWT